MEQENPTQLWDGNSDDGPLRQPKSHVAVESTMQDDVNAKFSNLNCTEEPKKKQILRPDADEWYPRDFQAPAPAFSVQDRLSRLRNHIGASSTPPPANIVAVISAENVGAKQDIERLQNIINTLTFDPGQFNSLLDVFMETFVPHFQNIEVINLMAEMLFYHAVNVPNFRYTSARLCYMVEQDCPIFRSTLHTICQKKLNCGESLQGLTLFVAELYSQLHYENLYGTLLLDAFAKLLTEADDANVKCICQALKLTGYSLGLYNTPMLTQIIDRLQHLRGTLSPSVANCLNSVIKLRNEDWGRSQVESVQTKSENQHPWQSEVDRIADDGTVYYNPDDGAELSVDEGVFLAENCSTPYLDGGYSDDAEELCDPEPEMDEEIQAAFKEFLKYSKQSK